MLHRLLKVFARRIRTRTHDFIGGQFAVILGHIALRSNFRQLAGNLDRLQPLFFDLIDLEQVALGFGVKRGAEQLVEHLLGPIQQAGLEVILGQFGEGMQTDLFIEIFPIDQVLVHADRPFGFTTATEQVAERKMQLDGLRIDLGNLEKGIDGLVRLFVEQEIQALKIGARQGARLMHHLAHIHPCRRPAQREKNRDQQQLPVFEQIIHTAGGSGTTTAAALVSLAARLRRDISRRWR